MPKRLHWIRELRPGHCNGFSNRSFGTNRNSAIGASKSLPLSTPRLKRSAVSMKRELPRVATIRPVSNGSTTAIEGRSRTASTTSHWLIPHPGLIACWTLSCIYPRSGPKIHSAEKNYIPDDVVFKTKPQIALDLIDRAKRNGIEVMAWTADELYGRNGAFLDGLDERQEAFVVEIPPNAHVWLSKPKVLNKPPKNSTGRPKKYPRLRRREEKPSEVQNLAKYSPGFREQAPQRYRIKDTHRGSEVWEIRWHTCWRKTHTEKLVSKQCTVIIARNVLTNETKYFLANRVPGRDGWSLRKILRVAFGRWPIEDCFRETKEELGLDHFECRGWRCIHRHLYVAILSQLFCARVRQQLSPNEDVISGELLTTEQVRRAANVLVASINLPPRCRDQLYREEAARQAYYRRRNAQAAKSHRKTRRKQLAELGIDPDRIKSVPPKSS